MKLFKKLALTIMQSKNTEILQFIPLTLHTKKNARMKYYTVVSDDCNLAQTEINIHVHHPHHFAVEFTLTGLQWIICPHSLKMSM